MAPDLQQRIARFGGYGNSSPEAWAEHDEAVAKWHRDRRIYSFNRYWEGKKPQAKPKPKRAHMTDFIIRLRADPRDGVRGLRQLLKTAWRKYRLKCVSVTEPKQEAPAGKTEETLEDRSHRQRRNTQ
jgi:hypothetical protein